MQYPSKLSRMRRVSATASATLVVVGDHRKPMARGLSIESRYFGPSRWDLKQLGWAVRFRQHLLDSA